MTLAEDVLADERRMAGVRVVRLPSLVRGRLAVPAWPLVGDIREAVAAGGAGVAGPTAAGSYLIHRPVVDRSTLLPTGELQVQAISAVDPGELIEPDPGAALRRLMGTPVDEICAFIDEVGSVWRTAQESLRGVRSATSAVDDRMHSAIAAQLPDLLDGAAVRAMLTADFAGGALLDGWSDVAHRVEPGISARMARNSPSLDPGPPVDRPRLRAVPTRQLHLTAGNTPVVPLTSLLWGWATKGACAVKSPAGSVAVLASLAAAMVAVDPEHPLSRHTSLTYWRGGSTAAERALLADGAFDRRVVWGSAGTVASVLERGGSTETIVMRPRHGISVIGAAAIQQDLAGVVRRAAVDTLIANQDACMSSLLHLVQGDQDRVDEYATALTRALADWDVVLPQGISSSGRFNVLRRGELAGGRWTINGRWPNPASAVVVSEIPFELTRHPGGRLVLVTPIAEPSDALAYVHPGVAHVGVEPESVRLQLADAFAACGVDNVLPLGEAERTYADRPHDGMRVLSRLVRWVNG